MPTGDPIMKSWQVKLQDAAKAEGLPDPLPIYGPDGFGGHETQTAILDYQARHGLAATGQFDDATRAALNPPKTDYSMGRSFLSLIIQLALKGGPNLSNIPDIAGWLNSSTVLGFLRNILISAGAWLTTSGFFTSAQWEQVVGALIIVVSAILSALANKKAADAKAVAKAVDAHPDLTVVPKSDGTAAVMVK